LIQLPGKPQSVNGVHSEAVPDRYAQTVRKPGQPPYSVWVQMQAINRDGDFGAVLTVPLSAYSE
jgi:hypothetical protein